MITACALSALAVACLGLGMFGRMITRERREHARAEQRWEAERMRLIDQVVVLAGKPQAAVALPVYEPRPEPVPDPDADMAVW